MTACDRRIQQKTPVRPPKTGWDYRQIINGLSEKMGIPVALRTTSQIEDEIFRAVPLYRKLLNGAFSSRDLFNDTFLTPTGRGRFATTVVDHGLASASGRRYLHDENYFEIKIKSRLTL